MPAGFTGFPTAASSFLVDYLKKLKDKLATMQFTNQNMIRDELFFDTQHHICQIQQLSEREENQCFFNVTSKDLS